MILYCNNKHTNMVHGNLKNSDGTKTSSTTSVLCQIFAQERMQKNCIWLLKYIGFPSSSELDSIWKKLYDFRDISLIFSDFICLYRNGKGRKGKQRAGKLDLLYILLLPVFCNCCFLFSFVTKNLLQPDEAFEKAGKINLQLPFVWLSLSRKV